MTDRGAIALSILVLLLCVSGWMYWRGGSAQKAEVRALRAEATATAASVEISTETATKVDTQAHETRQRTAQAIETIRHEIEAAPVAAGPADLVGLRIAQEAYDRAIRASCRVQRTSDCPSPAAAAD